MRRGLAYVVLVVYAVVAVATAAVHQWFWPRADLHGWWYYLRTAEFLPSAADAAPSQPTAVPVLTYHGVVSGAKATGQSNISFTRFVEHMEALVAAGYRTIGLSELEAFLRGEPVTLPQRPLVLTFDDARRDQYRNVDLVLERLGLRAVMFVPTRRVLDEHAFFLSWRELRQMHASGRWDLGCHGRDAHDPIPTGPATMGAFLANRMWLAERGRLETLAEFRRRIRADHGACRADLTAHVPGLVVRAYAFPFSDFGQIQAQASVVAENFAALRDTGFTLAFWNSEESFYNEPKAASSSNLPLEVRRLRVPGRWTGAELVDRLEAMRPQDPRPSGVGP
ncbi:MAG TPA: polysaccharide deacetylase family protein [Bacillota bacterium]